MRTHQTNDEPTGDQFTKIRAHVPPVAVLAERDDALGATARCVLAWARSDHPRRATVEASHFDLDGQQAALGRWSPTYTGDPPVLSEYADEFAAEADAADDPAVADACAVLAALVRGDDPPPDAARRIVKRASGE